MPPVAGCERRLPSTVEKFGLFSGEKLGASSASAACALPRARSMDEHDPILLHDRRPRRQQRYRLRLLGCLAASLLLVVAAVRLWPASTTQGPSGPIVYDSSAPVDRREVKQTKHAERTSPPPPPPPVPLYETDQQIEQEPLDLNVELAPAESPTEAPPGPPNPREGDAETSQSAAPEIGARQLRIPEPNYTEAARENDVRARIKLEVTIAPSGRVQDARIVRRVLLSSEEDGNGKKGERAVQALGYGLEKAALNAAKRTLFRPARAEGQAVKSRKTLTLTFGPGG